MCGSDRPNSGPVRQAVNNKGQYFLTVDNGKNISIDIFEFTALHSARCELSPNCR